MLRPATLRRAIITYIRAQFHALYDHTYFALDSYQLVAGSTTDLNFYWCAREYPVSLLRGSLLNFLMFNFQIRLDCCRSTLTV